MGCVRFIVTGHVQGVFFRASTRAEAERLKVSGYARNLDDGSVEVLACGDDMALDALERWLRRGPPAARVEVLRRVAANESPPPGFRTL